MATRKPTLTPEALKGIIDHAEREALAAREIQGNFKTISVNPINSRSDIGEMGTAHGQAITSPCFTSIRER